jgi:hypothetical protein
MCAKGENRLTWAPRPPGTAGPGALDGGAQTASVVTSTPFHGVQCAHPWTPPWGDAQPRAEPKRYPCYWATQFFTISFQIASPVATLPALVG